MDSKKQVKITMFDSDNKPMIIFQIFGIYISQLNVLDEYILYLPFDENGFGLFKLNLEKLFNKKLGACGISSIETPQGEIQRKNIYSWKYDVIGDFPKNK